MLGVSCSTATRLKRYSGDGEIKAKPDYGFWGGGGGYTLQFKPIKLDQPVHLTYHFSGLPQWHAEAFFAINDTRTWEGKPLYEWYQRTASPAEKERHKYACYDDLTGTLAMSLKDTKGNVVFQFEKKLRELRWSGSGGGMYELYDEKTAFFMPNAGEYILEVSIDPDPMLKDDEGYVLFKGGGHDPVSIGF